MKDTVEKWSDPIHSVVDENIGIAGQRSETDGEIAGAGVNLKAIKAHITRRYSSRLSRKKKIKIDNQAKQRDQMSAVKCQTMNLNLKNKQSLQKRNLMNWILTWGMPSWSCTGPSKVAISV